MKYKVSLHKRNIYVSPRPKKDFPGGIVVELNKPWGENSTGFIKTDIEAGIKEYELPPLPEGYFVKNIGINKSIRKDGKK